MCVLKKQFELLEFVLIPFMLTCSMMICLSLLLMDLCPSVVSVVVWSSFVCLLGCRGTLYVDAMFAVTMMRALLLVLIVCLLRVCDGVRLTEMMVWGCMRRGECRACGWYTSFRYCVWRS